MVAMVFIADMLENTLQQLTENETDNLMHYGCSQYEGTINFVFYHY